MAGLYPLSRIQQFDRNGRLLDGAKLYLYVGGTTNPLSGFADYGLTSPLPWPISADASGRLPLIYLPDGLYRHRLVTKDGELVFDDDSIPVLSETGGGGGGGGSVNPNALFKTRDIKLRFDDGPIPGYVRLNGRTIGNAASGATERANLDTQSLFLELWPYANITVIGGKGSSALADFNAGKQLVLPNAAGRALAGLDDMGAGAQNVLTVLSVTTPTLPGGIGGFQTRTLTQANVPSYVLTGGAGNISIDGNTDLAGGHGPLSVTGQTGGQLSNTFHHHQYGRPAPRGLTLSDGAGAGFAGETTAQTEDTNTDHIHNVTGSTESVAAHFHHYSFNGYATNVSISSGGSGSPFVALSPVLLIMIYISL